jgi:hypothetical protein
MRALLMRRRGNTPGTPHALTTAEGIIAGLVAGEPLMLTLTERSRAQLMLQVRLLPSLPTLFGRFRPLNLLEQSPSQGLGPGQRMGK